MPRRVPLWIGTSRAFDAILERCRRFAPVAAPLLLLGERGTGKSSLARYVHELSGRSGDFVPDSAPGIPESLEQGYLFGHVRGAFTGAERDREGPIELARGGTFFLDELGAARPGLQALLLRILDGAPIQRVGEARERLVDVRFMAATNEDLVTAVAEGRFRADLLDRFWPFFLRLPPLRERRGDIIPMAEEFLHRQSGKPLGSVPVLSREVRELFGSAPWLGNVRQLERLCQCALALSDGPSIEVCHLPEEFLAELETAPGGPLTNQQIESTLRHTGGNISEAARRLNKSRAQVHRVIRKAKEKAGLGDSIGA